MPTIKLTCDELQGQTGLKLWIYSAPDSIANAGGTDLTPGSDGLFTGTVTLAVGAYTCKIKSGTTVLASGGEIFVTDPTATILVDDPVARAAYQVSRSENLEAVKVGTGNTKSIEFVWPLAGEVGLSTIGGNAAFPTKTRRFRGQATESTIAGAITYVGLINGEHKWRMAYAIADRAADATTVVEDSVEYYLVDRNGRAGRMTLIISSAVGANSGAIVLPVSLAVQSRQTSDSLVIFIGETITAVMTARDASNNLVTLTGRTLKLYIDDARRKQLASVTPTLVSATTFTATLPTTVSEIERACRYALWDETTPSAKVLLSSGNVEVRYEPGPLSATP